MKISFDTFSRTVYIELEKKKVFKTIEFEPEVFLDFDKDNKLIGIELLNPVEVHFSRIASEYHIPEIKRINPQAVEQLYS